MAREQFHAHSLGPHVVGTRIVVRRVLVGESGPTGGPAFTDVLGVCESWAGGRVAIRRSDGTLVEIATADIVSGKPVPPRPSVRSRVSVRETESHAAPLWPQVQRRPVGEWELRLDPAPVGRPLKRANSCLAIGDPGVPLADAIERAVRFYRDHDRPPLLQVEPGSETESALRDAGWSPVPGGDAQMLVGSLARARRALTVGDDVIELIEDGPRAVSRCVIGEAVVGTAEAAYDGDWLGLHSLLVDPAHRRQGVASALVARLLEFGAENGCLTVWLHVETDNTPALAMYEALGLTAHHQCRYLGM